MNSTFGLYSQYYNLLYRDKDYMGEAAYIRSLIERFSAGTIEVLEFGCGTGKHARLLADSGYRVTGIEQSVTMIAAAAEKCTGIQIVQGDARHVRLDRRFDVALALFHVVSYQVDDDDVQAMFTSAAAHLRDAGIFIFDIWYAPAVLHQKPELRRKTMEDDSIRIVRIANPNCELDRRLVNVEYQVTVIEKASGRQETFTEIHPLRYFDSFEIERFALAAGMAVVHQEEWLTGVSPSQETWGVTFVLKKG